MTALEPELIEPLLAAGDVPVASLLTAGTHAFVTETGEIREAPLWVVASPKRIWVLATAEGMTFGEAWGEPFEVELQTGWTWDAIRVGRFTLRLRRGTRPSAKSLIAAFKEAGGGGERLPPPAAVETFETAPEAKGATGIPDWWARSTPAAPDERWLYGVELSSTHPFNQSDGTIVNAPLVLAVSDRRLALGAAHDGTVFTTEVTVFDHEARTTGRDRVQADRRELLGPVLKSGPLQSLQRLLDVDPLPAEDPDDLEARGRRFAAAARIALEDGDVDRAIRLWKEALELERHAGILGDVALVAYVLGKEVAAVAALAAHFDRTPKLDLHELNIYWRSHQRPIRKAARRQQVKWAHLRGALRPLLDSLEYPSPPEGLPWPPEAVSEVFAAALEEGQRYEDALSLWALLGDTPRGLAGLAALRMVAGELDAADSWRVAANAWRTRGDHGAARGALRYAAANQDRAVDHWQLAAWAWEDSEPDAARSHWRDALRVDEEGTLGDNVPLPADALRALIDVSTEAAHPPATARAWERLIEAEPDDLTAYQTLATLLESELARPEAAAVVLETAARRRDELDVPPESPRFELWVEIARLAALGAETETAIAALHEAIRGDFLSPEAYDAALSAAVELPEAIRDWWQHLKEVLVSGEDPPHPPLVESLDDQTLDGLHPGGLGWLERVRTSLDATEPPDRATLVRGLERMGNAQPEASKLLAEICEALSLDVPDAYLYRGDGAWGISAWPVHPPVILIGIDHLRDGPRQLSPESLRFALAVELAHLKCRHPLLAFDSNLIGTSRSVYDAFGKYAGTAENVVDLVTLVPGVDQIAKLQTIFRLSRKVFAARSTIDKATSLASPLTGWLSSDAGEATGIGREGLTGAALQFRLHADRVGLLLTGDLRASIDGILRSSTASVDVADAVEAEGLVGVLEGSKIPIDEAMRITAMVEFAAGQLPEYAPSSESEAR